MGRGALMAGLLCSMFSIDDAALAVPPVASVSAGGSHTCAVTVAGGAVCWGDNSFGQLGDGSTTSSTTAVDVRGLTSGVSAISAGDNHTCALTTTGGVKCWGRNGVGQLGDGTTDDSSTPVDVIGLTSGVIAVTAGAGGACALTNGGGVKCWGFNGQGELGNGMNSNSSTPVDVSGLTSGVGEISSGLEHTCALTSGGGVKCWGFNGQGRLGNGSTSDSSTPVNVTGLTSGAAAVSAGGADSCAAMSTGGVKCWGYGSTGALGNGGIADSSTPVDVTGLTGADAGISVGDGYTCAHLSGGGAKCWGDNRFGQLGDGTTMGSSTPVAVVGSITWSQISTGDSDIFEFDHTCGVTDTGLVECWGLNRSGELGNGTTTSSPMPVQLSDPTSTAVACAPATIPVNAPATCTVTVTDTATDGPTTPGASVSFRSDTSGGTFSSGGVCTLSPAPTRGQATCSVTYAPGQIATGTHTVAAGYGGEPGHVASSGSSPVAVITRSTSTTVSCTPAVVALGQPSTCIATVADTNTGAASAPSGTISFSAGSGLFTPSPICTLAPITAGHSACSVSLAADHAGSQGVSGNYGGDDKHAPSSGAGSLSISKRSTTTGVSCTPVSVAVGRPTVCTATVNDVASGASSAPRGSISFRSATSGGTFSPSSSCSLSPAATAGQASCSVSYTPGTVGSATHVITVDYPGDGTHAVSSGTGLIAVSAGASPFSIQRIRVGKGGTLIVKGRTSSGGRIKATARRAGRPARSARYGSGSSSAAGAGAFKLRIKPTGATRKVLKLGVRLRVTVTVVFTPTGGQPATKTATVRVKLKR